MTWNNSIFNDDRGRFDSFSNRDSDTHMHVQSDLHMTREDLRPVRELSGWEMDLVEAESDYYARKHEDYDNQG